MGRSYGFTPLVRFAFLTVALHLAGAGFNPAFAHSFNLLMVLPEAVHTDAKQAFLLASEEQDRHALEESDGHLGGLDVYITFAIQTDIDAMSATVPDIIALPLAGVTLPAMVQTPFLPPIDPQSPRARNILARASNPALPPFEQRFSSATGRPPGPVAKAIYVSARIISEAVRTTNGVEDLRALQKNLK